MKLLLAATLIALTAPALCLIAPVPARAADNDVMAADRAFSALSMEKGIPYAFWFYSSKTARLYGEHGGPKIGKAAITPKPDTRGPKLAWAPTAGAVSGDGKMGWTDGAWTLAGKDGTDTGHYVTVWVKEDGMWKVQADIGTTDIRAASKAKP
jgi:hypothetical protein